MSWRLNIVVSIIYCSLPAMLCAQFLYPQIPLTPFQQKIITFNKPTSAIEPIISLNPERIVFAFDLHGVMFRPDYRERAQILWHSPHKKTIAQLLLSPWFLYDLLSISTKPLCFEQVMNQLGAKYPTVKKIESTIMALVNAQRPIPETIDFIRQLKQEGFKIYLLSNINEPVLEQLKKKFPTIFSYFDGFVCCSAATGYIHKPDPRIYQQFLNRFNVKPDQVVFVDDLLKNIKAALTLGISGILFTSGPQLIREWRHIQRFSTITHSQPLPTTFIMKSSMIGLA